MTDRAKVVLIGGGTGTYVVGTGLKQYPLDLTAIVSVADSGGSTGRLRDEFGFQPVGDLRQALAAFSADGKEAWIRKLLLYRFDRGSGLEGHNLGNLILTALQDMTGSTAQAVEVASSVFRLNGRIYPVTAANIQLVIRYEDGSVAVGEHNLDESVHAGKRIVALTTDSEAEIYEQAKEALIEANTIIVGPGDLYGSIMPNLIVKGTREAFSQTHATLVYNANLMSKYAQTHLMTISDHISVLEEEMGKMFDVVVINNKPIPEKVKAYYESEKESELVDDVDDSKYKVIRTDLLAVDVVFFSESDKTKRSFLRHDSDKMAKVLVSEVIK